MKTQLIWTSVQRNGIFRTIYGMAYGLARRRFHYRTLKCVTITATDLRLQVPPDGIAYQARFLKPPELFEFARQSEYEMPEQFVRNALQKGDECFAILDGDILACFGWYSRKPTAITHDLTLHFRQDCVYMYFGYTHPRYRGQRLHAFNMGLALLEWDETRMRRYGVLCGAHQPSLFEVLLQDGV